MPRGREFGWRPADAEPYSWRGSKQDAGAQRTTRPFACARCSPDRRPCPARLKRSTARRCSPSSVSSSIRVLSAEAISRDAAHGPHRTAPAPSSRPRPARRRRRPAVCSLAILTRFAPVAAPPWTRQRSSSSTNPAGLFLSSRVSGPHRFADSSHSRPGGGHVRRSRPTSRVPRRDRTDCGRAGSKQAIGAVVAASGNGRAVGSTSMQDIGNVRRIHAVICSSRGRRLLAAVAIMPFEAVRPGKRGEPRHHAAWRSDAARLNHSRSGSHWRTFGSPALMSPVTPPGLAEAPTIGEGPNAWEDRASTGPKSDVMGPT